MLATLIFPKAVSRKRGVGGGLNLDLSRALSASFASSTLWRIMETLELSLILSSLAGDLPAADIALVRVSKSFKASPL